MARSERCRAASIAGVGRVFGTASSPPSKLRLTRGARSTGICTLSMPRSFAPTSTPPALAGPAPSGGEAPDEALGRSQGGFSTKIHLRAEGHGRPITAVLTGGERHEQIALEDVLDRGAIPRSGRGRPHRGVLAGGGALGAVRLGGGRGRGGAPPPGGGRPPPAAPPAAAPRGGRQGLQQPNGSAPPAATSHYSRHSKQEQPTPPASFRSCGLPASQSG